MIGVQPIAIANLEKTVRMQLLTDFSIHLSDNVGLWIQSLTFTETCKSKEFRFTRKNEKKIRTNQIHSMRWNDELNGKCRLRSVRDRWLHLITDNLTDWIDLECSTNQKSALHRLVFFVKSCSWASARRSRAKQCIVTCTHVFLTKNVFDFKIDTNLWHVTKLYKPRFQPNGAQIKRQHRQTDNFPNKRAKLLDCYVVILVHRSHALSDKCIFSFEWMDLWITGQQFRVCWMNEIWILNVSISVLLVRN